MDTSGEILDQGKVISGLSQKAVDTAQEAIGASTGGESFCYMEFHRDYWEGKPSWAYFRQYGKSPLYAVGVMVINLQFYDPNEPIESDKNSMARIPFKIGDLAVGHTCCGVDVPFNSASLQRQDYKINYTARNGWWTQDLHFKKAGDRWVAATRVFREGIIPPKLIFTIRDKDYPGEPDWYVDPTETEEKFKRQRRPVQRP